MTTDGGGPVPGRAGELAGGWIILLAGVLTTRLRWHITCGSWFHNMLAELEFSGRRARIRWDRTVSDQGGVPHLQTVCEADLS
jgi:hypothetical protein